MQSTTYYELSQYEANDKPTWLVGYNGDMAKIDAGIHEAKAAADDAQSTATSADGKADTNADAISDLNTAVGNLENAVGGAQGNINTLNALMGNGTPTTSDQTVIGAINALEATVATSEDGNNFANAYSIGDQFMRGGTLYEVLEPIASGTAWSAITLNTDVKISDTISTQISNITKVESIEIVADGVKTFVDIIKELNVLVDMAKVSFNTILYWNVNAVLYPYHLITLNPNSNILVFERTINEYPNSRSECVVMNISGNTGTSNAVVYASSDNSITFTDHGNDVPANGQKIGIRY